MQVGFRREFANILMHKAHLLLGLFLSILLPGSLTADELHIADVFTDNGVLQRDVALPVWGTTTANNRVTVRFADQVKTAQASEDGSWRVELAPLRPQGAGQTLTVESGRERLQFHNLLVGEVWYASGQSNMQMTLGACARKIPAIRDIAEADPTDNIRWLRIEEPDSPQPLVRRKKVTPWQLDHPDKRQKLSAVSYFFARRLQERLGVPVGILEGSWGGKPIEGFIPRSQFEKRDALRSILSLADQNKLDDLAALEGGVIVRNTAGMPGRIFNARVASIAPYPVRGFIWYQGESNAGRGEDPRNYRIKMRALVDGLRETWGQPGLPFYYVQLPAFKDESTGWIRLREEQRMSLEIPDTGMAVTIDLRDHDIHPANKLDVGERLANWALARTYGMKVPHSGPLFKSAAVVGDSMRVRFSHVGSGLMVAHKEGLAAPQPTLDVPLAHFELADEAGNWHPARATIDDTEVVVRSAGVTKPIAVRYACSGAPSNANLYSQAGLPASPFCSELKFLPWESQR